MAKGRNTGLEEAYRNHGIGGYKPDEPQLATPSQYDPRRQVPGDINALHREMRGMQFNEATPKAPPYGDGRLQLPAPAIGMQSPRPAVLDMFERSDAPSGAKAPLLDVRNEMLSQGQPQWAFSQQRNAQVNELMMGHKGTAVSKRTGEPIGVPITAGINQAQDLQEFGMPAKGRNPKPGGAASWRPVGPPTDLPPLDSRYAEMNTPVKKGRA